MRFNFKGLIALGTMMKPMQSHEELNQYNPFISPQ